MKQTNDTQAQIWCKKCKTLHAINAPCPLPADTPDTPATETETEMPPAKPISVGNSPTAVQKAAESVEIQKKTVHTASGSIPTVVPTSVPAAAQEDLHLVIVEVPVQLLPENASDFSFSLSKTKPAIFSDTEVSIGSQSYLYSKILYISMPLITPQGYGEILLNYSGIVHVLLFSKKDFAKMQIAAVYTAEKIGQPTSSVEARFVDSNTQSETDSTYQIKDIEQKQTAILSDRVCPYCNQKIHKNALICVHCGADLKNAEISSTPTASLASFESPERNSDSETPEEAKEDTSSFDEALLNGDSAEPLESVSLADSLPKPQAKGMSAKARIANGVFHCIMPIVWLAAPVFYLDAHYGYSPELALRLLLGDTTLPSDRYVPWEFAFEDIPSSIIFYILLFVLLIGHIMCAISIFKGNNSKVFKIAQPLPLVCSAITLICIQTEAYYLFNATLNDLVTLRTTPFAWLLTVIELALLVFTIKTKSKEF